MNKPSPFYRLFAVMLLIVSCGGRVIFWWLLPFRIDWKWLYLSSRDIDDNQDFHWGVFFQTLCLFGMGIFGGISNASTYPATPAVSVPPLSVTYGGYLYAYGGEYHDTTPDGLAAQILATPIPNDGGPIVRQWSTFQNTTTGTCMDGSSFTIPAGSTYAIYCLQTANYGGMSFAVQSQVAGGNVGYSALSGKIWANQSGCPTTYNLIGSSCQPSPATPPTCQPGDQLRSDNATCYHADAPDPNAGKPPTSCDNPNAENAVSAPPTDSAISENPVNYANGYKYWTETVYQGASSNLLKLVLSYTSRQITDSYSPISRVGINWTINLDRKLLPSGDGTSTSGPSIVYAQRQNGTLLAFSQSGNTYLSTANVSATLVRQANGSGGTTAWIFVDRDSQSTELYDPSGKLLTSTSKEGLVQTYVYDGINRLTAISDPFGHQIAFVYDTNNRISTINQPDGGTVTFAYDGNANLSKITWPNGKSKTYLYENTAFKNNLTGITDENGVRYSTYAYDAQGRVSREYLGSGFSNTLLSFGSGSTSITDGLGTIRSINYVSIFGTPKITGSSQPSGSGCSAAASSQTYDGNGNVATRLDFNGNLTTYTYDLSRNLQTQRVEASGSSIARTIATQWHPYWRLPIAQSSPLKLTTWVYNGDVYAGQTVTCAPITALVPTTSGGGRPIAVLCQRIEQATADVNGTQGLGATPIGLQRIWSWTYNSVGQVLTSDGPRTDVSDLTTLAWYAPTDPTQNNRGNIASITDALGHVTQMTSYDANGRLLSSTDPNGIVTQYSYDAMGRLTGKIVGVEGGSYQYDSAGQLTKSVAPDGASLTYAYDGAHRLVSIADNLNDKIQYTLDNLGNRTTESILDPSATVLNTRSRVFDALGRLWKDIGASSQTSIYTYDANGNQTSLTDPLSHVTTNTYDGLNRLIKTVDPNAGQASYLYNGRDQLVQVTDPKTYITTYTLDGLDNLTGSSSPDSGVSFLTVDTAGNVLTKTDAKAQTTQTTYDQLNRPIQVVYTDGSKVITTWDQGAYGIGRPAQIDEINSAGQIEASTRFTFDGLGRVLTETSVIAGISQTVSYAYSSGDLIRLTYPSGRQINYTRDVLGRITQATLTNGSQVTTFISQITYYPFGGGIKSYLNGAGKTVTRTQNLDGRISSYTLNVDSWLVGYDNAGRVTYQTNASNATSSITYGYDVLDRVTSAVMPSATASYAYDPDGNRTSRTIGTSTSTYSISSTSNRLNSISGSVSKTYSYDGNGSTTSDGTNTYGYDSRGRLTSSNALGGTTYRVDALGRRVRKSSSLGDVRYTYDLQGHLIAESSPATGIAKREYIWINDLPVAVFQ